jgi:hypothetical protein
MMSTCPATNEEYLGAQTYVRCARITSISTPVYKQASPRAMKSHTRLACTANLVTASFSELLLVDIMYPAGLAAVPQLP